MDYTSYDINLELVKSIFDNLLKGDLSILAGETIRTLNGIAMDLYSKPELNAKEVETLKYILMICNVLYNRTDMTVLPIEDGVYDLLLEKYKGYDKNFQVGSAVVDFKSAAEKDPNYKKTKCPIVRLEPHTPKNAVAQEVWDHIMRTGQPILNADDMYKAPLSNGQTISKRTHDTEHNHPDLVGTLDKCKFVTVQDAIDAGAINDPNVKILERDFFGKHIEQGIISPNQELEIVLELKYDGISVEADCTNTVISARTRGDTGVGVASDITPILEGYPFKHAQSMIGHAPIGVKFEAIMTKSDLINFCGERERNYVNCRTAIIGLFGASDGYKFRDYITLVPLAVDRNDMPEIRDRVVEIEWLNEVFRSNGEPLRYCVVKGNVQEILYWTKMFLDEASAARDYLNFMYDGIVVSYRDESIRARLGRENFINKYSMAVKFDPLSKITTFRGYTYEVGQSGTITPMLHYDPVEFIGTIHTKSSGSSLARFNDLALRYGDYIEVTYRNDVMPYVTKPDCEHNRQNKEPIIQPPTNCPVCGTPLVVSDSGKSLMCPNRKCEGRTISRVANMLAKMNLKGFGESTIKAIGKYTLYELANLDEEYLAPIIGEGNAANFVAMMNKFKTEPMYDYQAFGALGFTNIGPKKWQLILSAIDIGDFVRAYLCGDMDVVDSFCDDLRRVNGIGDSVVNTLKDEMYYFLEDIDYISSLPNIKSSRNLEKRKQIRFSGCRNLQLEQQLCNEGYDADSSSGVTKQTDILLVPYEGYTSTKTGKMSANGKIVPINDFIADPNHYLS